jgi:addiction module RelE/StbE family toxin
MIYRVEISEEAEVDMWKISDYISNEIHSLQSAINLMREIRKQIKSLNTMPKRYALVSDDELAKRGLRLIPVKNYLVFYTVDEQQKKVSITSVMYNKRDWINLLQKPDTLILI